MDYLHLLLPKLQHLGLWGYWVVLLAAFLESLAFVGLFIPGTTITIFVGFLAAQGVFDFGDLIWFVALGGILGDGISFYLGQHNAERLKHSRLFRAAHHKKGEEFFRRFGDMSIILARFIGPLRPVVPFVAGVCHLRVRKFIIFNVVGTFAASAVFLLIGYYFGGLWGRVGPWIEHIKVAIIIAGAAIAVGYLLHKKLFK